MPEISIVIPVYNVNEEYFNKCMKSILEQEFKDIEVILIDDGSTNGCEKLCDMFERKDSRVRTIHQKNSGVSNARNNGIKDANAEYIVFIDPDDWIEDNSLEVIYKQVKKYNSDFIIFSYFKNYKNKEIAYNKEQNENVEFNKTEHDMLQLNILNYKNKFSYINTSSVWAKCYKKSFLKRNNINFLEGQIKSQDTLFNLEVIEKADKIVFINDAVYHYRQSDASVCNKMNRNIDDILINVCYKVKEFIEKNSKANKFYEAHYLANIYIYKQILLLNYFHKDNKEKSKYKKKQWLQLIENEEIMNSLNSVNKKLISKKDKLIILLTKYKQYEILAILYYLKNKINKGDNNKFE